MGVRLLDRDPFTGITRWFHPAPAGGFTVHTQQDITHLVAENKALLNDRPRTTRWRDFEHAARIPLAIWFDLKRRGIVDDPKALFRWLNDPDNRAFRTREGRL